MWAGFSLRDVAQAEAARNGADVDRAIDETHDPALTSWVDAANDPATDFPIQNLPFGRFRRAGEAQFRIGVAIGDQVRRRRRARGSSTPTT